MSTEQTRKVADTLRENGETIWNEGNMDALSEFFAADVVVHVIPETTDHEGIDAVQRWIEDVRTAFPDFTVETTSVIVGEDRIASQWSCSGTHEGPMAGLDFEPTGKTVHWDGITVYRVEDEHVTEAWWYYDNAGLLAQLGLLPEPVPADDD